MTGKEAVSAMSVSAETFFDEALAVVDAVRRTQLETIRKAAAILAGCLLLGGVVHVFGSGHSRAFAMEMAGRAGGLAPVHAMGLEDLVFRGLRRREELDSPELERDPAAARELLGLYEIRPEDAFVVVSNSGRNGAPVELALWAKAHGHPVIAVTSMQHTTRVTSRHPSGKRLYEVADVVIDNGAPFGDALLDAGDGIRACSVSSVTGALIAEGLTAEIVRHYREAGRTPPVFVSANVDGADEHNERLRAEYAGRI